MTKKKVLLLSNTSSDAEELQNIIQALGHEIYHFSGDQDKLFTTVDKIKPDVLFIDIQPYHDYPGVKQAEVIKKKTKIPVIFITAEDNKGFRKRAKIKSASQFIVKPFHKREIEIVLETIFSNRSQNQIDEFLPDIYKKVVEQATEGILFTDTDGKIVEWNMTLESIFDLKKSEVIGKFCWDIYFERLSDSESNIPDYYEFLIYSVKKILKAGPKSVISYPYEISIRGYGDEEKIILIKHFSISTHKGSILAGIIKDITITRKQEENLRENEEKYRALFENMPNGFALMEVVYNEDKIPEDLKFLEINEAHLFWAGFKREVVQGKLLSHLFPTLIDKFLPSFIFVALTGFSQKFQYYSRHLDEYFTIHAFSHKKGQLAVVYQNVSDIQKISKELNIQKNNFQFLVENISNVIFTLDSSGNILYFSPVVEKISQYKVEDILGQNFLRFIHPEDLNRAQVNFYKNMHGEPTISEYRALDKDGSIINVIVNTKLSNFSEDTLVLTGLISNITEHKKIVSGYKEIQDLYKKLVELSPDLIIIHADNKIIFANTRGIQQFGLNNPKQIHGKSLFDFVDPQDSNLVRKFLLDNDESKFLEIKFRMPSGQDIWVVIRSSSISFEGHDASLVILRNISERKNYEEELRKSEETLRAIFDKSPIGIALAKIEGRKLFKVNPEFSKMLGYDENELKELSVNDITHPDDLINENELGKRIVNNELDFFSMEKRFITKKKQIMWVNLIAGYIKNEKDEPLYSLGIVENITERKIIEDEIKKNLEREKELNQLKNQFISLVSHEFRSPLTTIATNTDILKRYGNNVDNSIRDRSLKRIFNSVNEMTFMLEEISIMNKEELGILVFKPESINIEDFIQYLVEITFSTFGNEINIGIVFQSKVGNVMIDKSLLKYIIVNILSNAVKYSESGNKVDFELNTTPDDQILFTIQDYGMGISKEDLKHIFEPFYRAPDVAEIQGLGLGMSIVKKCVDLHKGKISIASELKKGTKVVVSIPFIKPV